MDTVESGAGHVGALREVRSENPNKPVRVVFHFKSAGMRRKYERGEIPIEEAIISVPIYRSLPSRYANWARGQLNRLQRRMAERGEQ